MLTNWFQHNHKPKINNSYSNFIGASDALFISELAETIHTYLLVITPSTKQTLLLEKQLAVFSEMECIVFPAWDTLPYDFFSPQEKIISDRLIALNKILSNKPAIILVSIDTLMQKIAPADFLIQNTLMIQQDDIVDVEKFILNLEYAGYHKVKQVMQHGEYAHRGSIIDLFPMGSAIPFRIDLLGDEIDSIRTFDVDTQRSLQNIQQVKLLPAHEFPTNSQGINLFREQFVEQFDLRAEPEHVYQQVSKGFMPLGIEYWQPLFFRQMVSLFDYLPENLHVCCYANLAEQAEKFYTTITERYQQHKVDPMRPLLHPEQLWLTYQQLDTIIKKYQPITINKQAVTTSTAFPIKNLPNLIVKTNYANNLKPLQDFITAFTGNIVFVAETLGRATTLLELLQPLRLNITPISLFNEAERHQYSILIGTIGQGFISQLDKQHKIAIISEFDLLTIKLEQRAEQHKHTRTNTENMIKNLVELKIDQAVVHLEHGIGLYKGLIVLDVDDIAAEYLLLEYANNAKLYVPIADLHLINRYVGGSENVVLHKLGSDTWQKNKQKTLEKIHDIAVELLDIYASQQIQQGFCYQLDEQQYKLLVDTFAYETTPDQQAAIDAVIQDMCSTKIMDRLVCGDVGFGKTEVAIRSAFIAAMNNKQVAILVPTTLLATQHYENFVERFSLFPFNIEVLSRFKTAKQQQQILEQAAAGQIDILIGTHKLLQNDVKFKDLGLLIIDEEHRFGVRQKEKIKQLRGNLDILTLTATPIPRTLNMALNGIRDLSIIATAPNNRLDIKTIIKQSEPELIREAMIREVSRGGQVYFLHNNIDTIAGRATQLQELIPEANIAVAHGQMKKNVLEKTMADFYNQHYNVLVCSTIIETGIDNPNANTMIIERADKFGLAQLHQLRGRVGRSIRQAYVYMLVPHTKLMTKDAVKRLEAIASIHSLGAGFILANHDLEIRGAGELLGEEQSGQIATVGFTLYTELLEQTIHALKNGQQPSLANLHQQQIEVDLTLPALLPEHYIADIGQRLSIYKQLASITDFTNIEDLKVELIDRFGSLPEPAENLLVITKLKLIAKQKGITAIHTNTKYGSINFDPQATIDADKLFILIQQQADTYQFAGPLKLKFKSAELIENRTRLSFIQTLLTELI